MKPTKEDLAKAILTMADIIPFFPQTPTGQKFLLSALESFVGTRDQLLWLTNQACNQMLRWEGPAQLRAIFVTRFPPADGVESTGGSTSGEGEMAYFERESRETDKRLLNYRSQLLLNSPAEPDPQSNTDAGLRRTASKVPLRRLESDLAEKTKQYRTNEETARILADLKGRLHQPPR